MSEKYPNAYGRPDEELDAIYSLEHLTSVPLVEKIAARWKGEVVDLPLRATPVETPENWDVEETNPKYPTFLDAA